MMIIWRRRGFADEDVIPESEALEILHDVRRRKESIEQHVLHALVTATSESRRSPRRHQALAILILLPLVFLLIMLAIWLGQR